MTYSEAIENVMIKLWSGYYKDEYFSLLESGQIKLKEGNTSETEKLVAQEMLPDFSQGVGILIGIAGGIKSGNKLLNKTTGTNVNGEMLGKNGTSFTSKTVLNDQRGHIDVENPNPGTRAGQIHYQPKDSKEKYLYDPVTNTFPGAPPRINALLKDTSFKDSIQKAMKYLGEI